MAESVEDLLAELARGSERAMERLLPLIYEDLRALARAQRRRLPRGQTLDTTELVHETYLKVMGTRLPAHDAGHVLAILARAMRQVLVDAARRRAAAKRGGGLADDTLDEELLVAHPRGAEILDVEAALDKLRALDERLVQVVECRFFAGLSEAETAVALDLSARTVHRDWLRARAWLQRALGRGAAGEGAEEEPEGVG